MTEKEWLVCEDPLRMLDFLAGKVSNRKMRLFACACFREGGGGSWGHKSLAIWQYAMKIADHPVSAIELAAEHAITSPALIAEYLLRQSAFDAARGILGHYHDAAPSQAFLLRDIVGNFFREKGIVWRAGSLHQRIPNTEERLTDVTLIHNEHPYRAARWLTSEAIDLATVAYERLPLDPLRLAVLADALEEAGCQEEEMLRHLRGFERCLDCMLPSPEEAEYGGGSYWCPGCGGTEGGNPHAYWQPLPGPHVHGCWALDLILGKE